MCQHGSHASQVSCHLPSCLLEHLLQIYLYCNNCMSKQWFDSKGVNPSVDCSSTSLSKQTARLQKACGTCHESAEHQLRTMCTKHMHDFHAHCTADTMAGEQLLSSLVWGKLMDNLGIPSQAQMAGTIFQRGGGGRVGGCLALAPHSSWKQASSD